MDILISTAELRAAISRTTGIVEAKATMPILGCVLLEAEVTPAGGRLHVRAYDLEVGLISSHPCEVKKPGVLAVPAKALLDVCKVAPESVTRLKGMANNRLEVTSGGATFRLAGHAGDDFPAIPGVEGLEFWSFDRETMAVSIGKVAFSISNDPTRYNLNGILFTPVGEGMDLVATDGHRLAKTTVNGPNPLKEGVIVSSKAVGELSRLLKESNAGTHEWGVKGGSLAYRRAGLTFVARLIDGTFPDYTQVVPKMDGAFATCQRSALADVLKRVTLMTADKASSVQMTLTDGRMDLTSRNPDVGDASDCVNIDYSGPELKLNLNGRYLLEMLASVEEPVIQIHIEGDTSPVCIRPVNDQAHVAVIMPMRA